MSTMTEKQLKDLKAKVAKQEDAVEKARSDLNKAHKALNDEVAELDKLVAQVPEPSHHEVISGYMKAQKTIARDQARKRKEQEAAMKALLQGGSGGADGNSGDNKAGTTGQANKGAGGAAGGAGKDAK